MGLAGRREAISAPTVGYASESTPVSTARPGPSLSSLSPGGRGTSTVKKSSKRASAMSAAHTTHSDQATNAAVRWLIQLTPRPCSLVPSITTPLYSTTVAQALRQTLRAGVPREYLPAQATHRDMGRHRGYGGGTQVYSPASVSMVNAALTPSESDENGL